jgi:hypothetical protein
MVLTIAPHPESVTNANAQTDESVNGRAPGGLPAASASSVAGLRLASGGPAAFLTDLAGSLAAGDRVSLPSAARVTLPNSAAGAVGTGQAQGTLSVTLPRLVFPWNTDSEAVDLGFSVGEGRASLEVSAQPLTSNVLDLFFASLDEGSDGVDTSAIP